MQNAQVEQPTLREELATALKQAEQTQQEEAIEEQEQQEPADLQETEEEVEDDGGELEEVEEDSEDTAEEIAEKEFPLIPNNWSEEEKEAFQALLDSDDDDKRMAAEIMLERYNSFKKTFFDKTHQYAKDTKEYKEINKVFEPVQQMMEQNNVDKASYIKNMMAWEYNLSKDPVNTVKAIMQKFNVRPEQIVPKEQDDFDFDDDGLTAERNNANNNYVSKQELEELRTAIANQPILAQIAQFANATDSSGKLLHPRFEEVKPIMGQIIQSKKATTLDDAYRKAIRVIDDEKPQQDEPAIDIEKIKQKVKRAKKASKGVKTGGGKPDIAKMSIRDELIARLKQS